MSGTPQDDHRSGTDPIDELERLCGSDGVSTCSSSSEHETFQKS
ncbi:hypothetical protein [Halostagnicola sp. A56]|nr:hypothetical protein [Halostagnicola sp. A56]